MQRPALVADRVIVAKTKPKEKSCRERSATRRAKNQSKAKKRAHRRIRARPVLPGQSLKITFRCLERRFLMATGRNHELIRKIFGYLLGVALKKYGVRFHAGIQMSDHHHLDITDVRGLRPLFKVFFHSLLARAINSFRGRTGKFWEAGGSCDTERDNDEDSIGDLLYTDANPVAAGLVKWADKWPGFSSAGWAFGETREFERPDIPFFDVDETDWPSVVKITRVRPPCLHELTDDEATELLADRVRQHDVDVQHEMRRQHRRFKGINKLRKESWTKVLETPEDKFKVEPKVATRVTWRRLAMIQRNRAWEAKYAAADDAFAKGERGAAYPPGTWLMRRRYKVCVAAA